MHACGGFARSVRRPCSRQAVDDDIGGPDGTARSPRGRVFARPERRAETSRARRRSLPLRRRLPRHALSRRRALAAQRARLPAEARPRLERLRRLDHRRRARHELARPRVRRDGVATNFDEQFVHPFRQARVEDDRPGRRLRGILLPGTISDRVAGAYRKHVFGDATLQDLPDRPRFVINSTNIQTGSLWRFSKPYMADYQVGMVREPRRRARPRGRRVLGLSADPLAGSAAPRPGELRSGRDAGRCTCRRTRPTSCSPTAASTTTSASRPPGSATRRSSSATAAAR